MHLLKELALNRISSRLRDHSVDPTLSTEGGLIIVDPFRYVFWVVDRNAVKTSANLASRKLSTVVATMAVCSQVILIEAWCGEAQFDHGRIITNCRGRRSLPRTRTLPPKRQKSGILPSWPQLSRESSFGSRAVHFRRMVR